MTISPKSDESPASLEVISTEIQLNEDSSIWFTFQGTGDHLRVSTCSSSTTIDTVLTLFRGDCEDLTQVAHNDDDYACRVEGNAGSIFHSSITNVPTEVNSWYYFRISAFSGQLGTVGLTMTNLAEGQQQNDPITNTSSPSPTTPPHHRISSSSKKTSKSTKSSKSSKAVLGIKTKRTKSGGFGSSKKRLVKEHNNTRV